MFDWEMVKEFEVITDWYNGVDKTGKPKIVKKNLIIKREFEVNDMLLAEYANDKGNVVKKYSLLIDKDKGDTYKINMPYEKAKKYVGEDPEGNRIVVNGYMAHRK